MALRIGFVGSGGIANWHMSHLAQIKGVEMVAFADVDKSRAVGCAEKYGGQAFTDFKKMYDKVDLDAVYCCLPPFAHGDQELLALKKGCHLFVEKPIALDLKLAKKIERAAASAGVITGVGFQDRYQDIVGRLKKELVKNPAGLVMGYWMGGMPGVMWWRRKEQSGGQIVEQTIHTFDMARNLFGEVASVHAVGSKGLLADVPKYNIEDASAVNLKFKSGLAATIFSACFLKVGSKVGLDIYAKEALYQYAGRSSLTITRPGADPEFIKKETDEGMAIDTAFINAIKKGKQELVKSSYADAVKSLAICLAANESMKTGQVVKL
jgi:myo-inositol 2-dehydrogenase / D-chiro-inositol 1-dehydrogenase